MNKIQAEVVHPYLSSQAEVKKTQRDIDLMLFYLKESL
jgi:hypothetical protein